MILIIDGLNKHKYGSYLEQMYRLRARVFGDRLGWKVSIKDGMEKDKFDNLDPSYVIGFDDSGNVISCVRALQTTGPHMLADVFSAILDGQPPLRNARLWESTRFCVDTKRLGRGKDRNSVSYATSELMIGSLEYARDSGISDIVTVIDPLMDRILKRSDNAPYGYVGKQADMGKVPALAALLDCTDERIDRLRSFSGIHHDVFISEDEIAAAEHFQPSKPTEKPRIDLHQYCNEQINSADNETERAAAIALQKALVSRFQAARICDA